MSCTIYDFSLNTKSSLTVLHPQCIKKKLLQNLFATIKLKKILNLSVFEL